MERRPLRFWQIGSPARESPRMIENEQVSNSRNVSESPEERPATSTMKHPQTRVTMSTYVHEVTPLRPRVFPPVEEEPNNLEALWAEDANIYNMMIDEYNAERERPLPKTLFNKLEKMKMGASKQACTVCCNPFHKGEIIRKLPCKHVFHDKCIKPWFAKNSSCPNCRFDIVAHFANQNQ